MEDNFFTRMVRNLMFRHVQLFAMEKERELAELDSHLDDAPDWPSLMDDYFGEYDDVDLGPAARGPEHFRVDDANAAGEAPDGGYWRVEQTILDPEDDRGWRLVAEVDLAESDAAGEVRLRSLEVKAG